MDKSQVRSCISGSGSITYDPLTGIIGGGGGGTGTVTSIATAGLISGGTITTTGTITTSMATNKLVGRATAGTGIMEEITLGAGLSFTGTTLNVTGSGLTVGTTPIASGTAGRILFEGAGNVLQESSILNLDTTNGQIIGGATARGTRQTIINSANTYATKIFVQRNAADSADYTTLRGDGVWDFNNVPNTATINTLLSAGGSALLSLIAQPSNNILLLGFTNALSYTGGAVNNTAIVGGGNTIVSGTGATFNYIMGNSNVIRNCTNSLMIGQYIEISGASRTTVIGGRATSGVARAVTGNDNTVIGYALDTGNLAYTASLTTYFNNANASHWLHKNGNIGLFGQAYQILSDSGSSPLNSYMNLTATNTLTIHNGTATTGSIANAVQVYAADQTAGNSALFVRTENNDIVKIYSIGGWGTPTGTLTRTTFDTTTVTLSELAERVAALISDLKTGHQLLKA